jgi:hypothetical protein
MCCSSFSNEQNSRNIDKISHVKVVQKESVLLIAEFILSEKTLDFGFAVIDIYERQTTLFSNGSDPAGKTNFSFCRRKLVKITQNLLNGMSLFGL